MDFVTLGRTGLRVSVLGLGGGGHSRLGQSTGRSADESVAVVRRALDLGVNFIDTAEGHRMLGRAVEHDCWDVYMVGLNVLNQSARPRVLGRAIEKDIGILVMFAVRNALSRPERLVEVIGELIDAAVFRETNPCAARLRTISDRPGELPCC